MLTGWRNRVHGTVKVSLSFVPNVVELLARYRHGAVLDEQLPVVPGDDATSDKDSSERVHTLRLCTAHYRVTVMP